MSAKSAVLFRPAAQVSRGESLFTPRVGFVEAFRALSRQMREERGLELYDIAGHVRRSESSVSKWESGDTDQPDGLDSWLSGYATAFGMPTTELIEMIAQRMTEAEAAAASEFSEKLTEPPADEKPKPGRSPRKRRAS